MGVNREKIHKLVELFYQPTSKTFYINSVDGKNFIKPIGVFVSLGITTSRKVLEDIKDTLSEYDYNVVIAEISSKKVGGQYLNTLTNTSPTQYELIEFDESVMNEEQAKKELTELEEKMNPSEKLEVLQEFAPKVSKLQDLINKLDETDGWDAHMIQRVNDEGYKIFHKFVNYRKEVDPEIEYRIGLYVTEKS